MLAGTVFRRLRLPTLVAAIALGACTKPAPPARAPASPVLPTLPLASLAFETSGFADGPAARLVAVWGRYGLHQRDASALAYSGDGGTLVSASARGTIRVWHAATSILRCSGADPRGLLPMTDAALAVSQDGRRAATGRRTHRFDGDWEKEVGEVTVWDLTACSHVRTFLADRAPIVALAFTDSDRALATFGYEYLTHANDPPPSMIPRDWSPAPPVEHGGEVRVWDLGTGALRSRTWLGAAHALAFSPDRRRVAGYDARSRSLRLWDLAHPDRPRWQHTGPVEASGQTLVDEVVGFADDGRVAFVRDLDVQIFDAATGRPSSAHHLRAPLRADPSERRAFVRVAPDLRRAVGHTQKGLSLCVLGGECRQMPGSTSWLLPGAFAPDSRRFTGIAGDGDIALWDLTVGAEVERAGHRAPVTSIALSPDGTRALTCGSRGELAARSVRLWNVATGAELTSWPMAVDTARFGADGKTLIVTDSDLLHGRIAVLDLHTGRTIWEAPGSSNDTEYLASWQTAHSTTGSRIARVAFVDGQPQLVMHDARTGERLWSRPSVGDPVAFALDREVVAPNEQGTLSVYDAGTGRQTRSLAFRSSAASITPDGSLLVTASPGLRVYDLATARLTRQLEADWSGPYVLTADGLVVTGEHDGTIRFRRLDGGADVGRIDLATSEDIATALQLADSDRELLVGTARGVILRFRRP